jgi:hypothetical protein
VNINTLSDVEVGRYYVIRKLLDSIFAILREPDSSHPRSKGFTSRRLLTQCRTSSQRCFRHNIATGIASGRILRIRKRNNSELRIHTQAKIRGRTTSSAVRFASRFVFFLPLYGSRDQLNRFDADPTLAVPMFLPFTVCGAACHVAMRFSAFV